MRLPKESDAGRALEAILNAAGYAVTGACSNSPRPTTFAQVFADAQRWAERTFLVHGQNRMRSPRSPRR